jgi:uncharacterized Zn-finger protein
MAKTGTPKFHNDMGVSRIEIGAREFECVGAKPPFDHPHIFIDMGGGDDAVCPYCSTHYHYDASLKHGAARPAEAAYTSADI